MRQLKKYKARLAKSRTRIVKDPHEAYNSEFLNHEFWDTPEEKAARMVKPQAKVDPKQIAEMATRAANRVSIASGFVFQKRKQSEGSTNIASVLAAGAKSKLGKKMEKVRGSKQGVFDGFRRHDESKIGKHDGHGETGARSLVEQLTFNKMMFWKAGRGSMEKNSLRGYFRYGGKAGSLCSIFCSKGGWSIS